ncbi:MAG: lysine 5,6-aminomutase subunit alpha [Bacillota bacterium]
MQSQLGLDPGQIRRARDAARRITGQVQAYIDQHTTTSTERAILRLLDVNGVDADGVPLPNCVVDNIMAGQVSSPSGPVTIAGGAGGPHSALSRGAAYWLCNAMLRLELSAQEVAEAVGRGALNLIQVKPVDDGAIHDLAYSLAETAAVKIRSNRQERDERIRRLGDPATPWLYIIVATGNIYEDVVQARAAVKQGADVIAVIRSTAQSLLDYVPYGPTTEGFAGTYATQANFRIMRQALDEASEEVGRYVRLTNYASGLCMPEIAAMGALERLDMMLNDSLYGILFRDINMRRTFIDQHFSRMLNAYAGIIINTGEDNYLTTTESYEAAHTVLASQFINEQFALRSGLPVEQMGLGHAFQMDPTIEDGFLHELAQAQMAREIFPGAPLKYMPPTRHMTGNIFQGHLLDAMHNLVSVMTDQHVHLVGMLTEAIHTPFLQDRYLSIENFRYIVNNARHLGEEITFKPGGRVQQRAQLVLNRATDLLEEIERVGLMQAIEQGLFAGMKRSVDGGKGLDGVVAKGPDYLGPFPYLMLPEPLRQAHADAEAAIRVRGGSGPVPASAGATADLAERGAAQ